MERGYHGRERKNNRAAEKKRLQGYEAAAHADRCYFGRKMKLLQGNLLSGVSEGSEYRTGDGIPYGQYAGADRSDQPQEYVPYFG